MIINEIEPCEDEYIKVPKKALKYGTAGMVAYNVEWLKKHFDIERAVICGEQEPNEGEWILTDVERDRVWHCNCSKCNKDPLDLYVGGSENWWLIKTKLPRFCPNCGAKNVKEE